jgi:hypothetical protein
VPAGRPVQLRASLRFACREQDRTPCSSRWAHGRRFDSFRPVRVLPRGRHQPPRPTSRQEPRVVVVAAYELDRPLMVGPDEGRLGFVHVPPYSRYDAAGPRPTLRRPEQRPALRPCRPASARFVVGRGGPLQQHRHTAVGKDAHAHGLPSVPAFLVQDIDRRRMALGRPRCRERRKRHDQVLPGCHAAGRWASSDLDICLSFRLAGERDVSPRQSANTVRLSSRKNL